MSKANGATEVSYRCSISIQERCIHDTLSMQASTLFQAESSDAAAICNQPSHLFTYHDTEYGRANVRVSRMNDLGLARIFQKALLARNLVCASPLNLLRSSHHHNYSDEA